MALVNRFEKVTLERNRVHDEAAATYTVFTASNGECHLQLDTYGSENRKIKGKKSQSIQLGPKGIANLRTILNTEL